MVARKKIMEDAVYMNSLSDRVMAVKAMAGKGTINSMCV